MSDQPTQDVLWFLLDLSLKGCLLSLAAGSILRFFRVRDAGLRHSVWAAVLAGMLILAPLGGLGAAIPVPAPAFLDLRTGPPSPLIREATLIPQAAAETATGRNLSVDASASEPSDHRSAVAPASPPSLAETAPIAWTLLLLGVYASGVLLVLGRVGLGLLLRRSLLGRAVPLEVERLDQALDRLSEMARIPRPALVMSTRARVPFAVPGSIVLPPSWMEWPQDRLESVLAHELAHLKRRDSWIQLASWINRAFYWFHPAALWVARSLARNAEEACDLWAVRWTGQTPRGYAEHLLEVAAPLTRQPNRVLIGGVPMARSSQVRSRIESLFHRGEADSKTRWTTAAALIALILSVSSFRLAPSAAPPETLQRARERHSGYILPMPMPMPMPTPTPQPTPTPMPSSKTRVKVAARPATRVSVKPSPSPRFVKEVQEEQPLSAEDRKSLLLELRSASAEERADAAYRLREGKADLQTIAALVALLGDTTPVTPSASWRERHSGHERTDPGSQAAITLGRFGEAAVDSVLAAFRSDRPETRDHAALALGLSGSKRAEPALLDHFSDPVWNVRKRSVWGIGILKSSDSIPLLETALVSDQHPEVREMAAWSLGLIEDSRSVLALADALRDVNPHVREMSAWALGLIQDSRSIDALIGALDDESAQVREKAVWAFGLMQAREAIPALTQVVHDSDAEVRSMAVWALGLIGDREGIAALGDALRDDSPQVREKAVWAMGLIQNRNALPALELGLDDGDEGVREMAAWALGLIRSRDSVPILLHALDDESSQVREKAAWALGLSEALEASPGLSKALRDPSDEVREQAAWALGLIGGSEGVPALIGSLRDESDQVQEMAAWALGIIGDSRAVSALSGLEQDSQASSSVRSKARWALRMMGRE